jgi:hypothetical protein
LEQGEALGPASWDSLGSEVERWWWEIVGGEVAGTWVLVERLAEVERKLPRELVVGLGCQVEAEEVEVEVQIVQVVQVVLVVLV